MSCNYSIHNGQLLLSLFLSLNLSSHITDSHTPPSPSAINALKLKTVKQSHTLPWPYSPIPKFNRVYCGIKFSSLTLPLPSYQNLISDQKICNFSPSFSLSRSVSLSLFFRVLHFPQLVLSKVSIFIRFRSLFPPLTIIIITIIIPFIFYPIFPPTKHPPEFSRENSPLQKNIK